MLKTFIVLAVAIFANQVNCDAQEEASALMNELTNLINKNYDNIMDFGRNWIGRIGDAVKTFQDASQIYVGNEMPYIMEKWANLANEAHEIGPIAVACVDEKTSDFQQITSKANLFYFCSEAINTQFYNQFSSIINNPVRLIQDYILKYEDRLKACGTVEPCLVEFINAIKYVIASVPREFDELISIMALTINSQMGTLNTCSYLKNLQSDVNDLITEVKTCMQSK